MDSTETVADICFQKPLRKCQLLVVSEDLQNCVLYIGAFVFSFISFVVVFISVVFIRGNSSPSWLFLPLNL